MNRNVLFALLSITIFLFSACGKQNKLENSTWKFCGDSGSVSDILIFDKTSLYERNDSLFFAKSDSLIGVVDKIERYYGERRLFVKDLKGNVGRYCEQ